MKVYLAAAWSRREEIRLVADRLRAVGVEITSNWLTEETGMQSGGREKFLRDRAHVDLNDVDRADALVRFTDVLGYNKRPGKTDKATAPAHLVSGARHVEFGYAKARGKALYVVGGKQNVFDRMAGVIHIADTDELVRVLSSEDDGGEITNI